MTAQFSRKQLHLADPPAPCPGEPDPPDDVPRLSRRCSALLIVVASAALWGLTIAGLSRLF